jgi:hypothetical protein
MEIKLLIWNWIQQNMEFARNIYRLKAVNQKNFIIVFGITKSTFMISVEYT